MKAILSDSHSVLVGLARSHKKTAVNMLETGNRSFQLLRKEIEKYIHFQTAADIVSGQYAPTNQGNVKDELMRELSELHTLVSAGTGSDAESSVMLKHVSCRLDAILDRAQS